MKKSMGREIHKSVNDLVASMTSLVRTLDRAARQTGGEIGRAAAKVRGGLRGAFTPSRRAKLKKSIRAYWSKLTPEQHAERVRKMLAGRGLKPKGATKKGATKRKTRSRT